MWLFTAKGVVVHWSCTVVAPKTPESTLEKIEKLQHHRNRDMPTRLLTNTLVQGTLRTQLSCQTPLNKVTSLAPPQISQVGGSNFKLSSGLHLAPEHTLAIFPVTDAIGTYMYIYIVHAHVSYTITLCGLDIDNPGIKVCMPLYTSRVAYSHTTVHVCLCWVDPQKPRDNSQTVHAINMRLWRGTFSHRAGQV